jgi:hypothetical protein
LGFQTKQIIEQFEIGPNALKSFAQVHKDGNVENQIRIQMQNLQLIEVEEATEEI